MRLRRAAGPDPRRRGRRALRHPSRLGGRPEYGNAILGREPLRLDVGDRVDLGRSRSALRVPVTLPSGARFDFVVTHLHHEVPDEAVRAEQASKLTAWLADITCRWSWSATSTPSPSSRPTPECWRLASGRPTPRERRRAGRHLAVGDQGTGPGPRWRAGLPRLHLAAGRDHGRGLPPCVRPAGGRRPHALYPSDHLGSRRTSGSVAEGAAEARAGEGACAPTARPRAAADFAARAPRRLAQRARELPRGMEAPCWSGLATASSSTSAPRATASRSCSTTRPSAASRASTSRRRR